MKRLRKKAALDVSINSIVVIIFAIVMLGLGIAFINGMFGSIQKRIISPPESVPPASPSEPISLLSLSDNNAVHRGESVEFTIKVYNGMNTAISKIYDKPKITECVPNSVNNLFGTTTAVTEYVLSTPGQTIPVGQEAAYKVIMTVGKNANLGKNVCSIELSATTGTPPVVKDTVSTQFPLEVK